MQGTSDHLDQLLALHQHILLVCEYPKSFNHNATALLRELKSAMKAYGTGCDDSSGVKHALKELHYCIVEAREQSDSYSEPDLYEVSLLARDLGIRIVEEHCRPDSLEDVRLLKPAIQQAGLGYLLYSHFHRQRTTTNESRRETEAWINFIWDTPERLPLSDAAVSTTEDLISWLRCHTNRKEFQDPRAP